MNITSKKAQDIQTNRMKITVFLVLLNCCLRVLLLFFFLLNSSWNLKLLAGKH